MKKWRGLLFTLLLILTGCSSGDVNEEESTLAPYYGDKDKEAVLLSDKDDELNDHQEELFYQVARGGVESMSNYDLDGWFDNSLRVEKVKGKGKYRIVYTIEDEDGVGKYTSEMIVALKSEDLADDERFDISDYSSDLDKLSNLLDTSQSTASEPSEPESQPETNDITVLSENPSSGQLAILDDLANQQFKEEFPYKGSKLHRIMGVMQKWTSVDGEWFYKAEATIVNGFGAKESKNVEIYITPTGPDTGLVRINAY